MLLHYFINVFIFFVITSFIIVSLAFATEEEDLSSSHNKLHPSQKFSFVYRKKTSRESSTISASQIKKALFVNEEEHEKERSENANTTSEPTSIAKNEDKSETTSSSICPDGSTAEGIWGLNSNNFYFTSPEYYYLQNSSSSRSLGSWSVGPRQQMLEDVCRIKGIQTFKHPATNRTIEVPGRAFCDWNPKPIGFNPFRGAKKYWVNESAAIYKVVKQQQNENSIDYSPSPLSFCYDFQSASLCLRDKIIVFIGDSHVLNLAEVLCRMVVHHTADPNARRVGYGPCGGFDARFMNKMNAAYLRKTNTTIALLRVRYDLQDQMKSRFDSHPWASFLNKAHFVVVGRGMWDIVYKDTPKKELTYSYSESLKFVARRFQDARIIVKMVHYDHKHMKGCSTDERLMELRDSNICSAFIAQSVIAQEEKQKQERHNDDPFSRFSILDSYGMTREVEYGQATDELGHHYEGSVMESMTQQLLSIMCPSVKQNHQKIFEEVTQPIGRVACKRMLERARTTEKRMPKCSCNDVENGGYRHPEALDFCKKFYGPGANVAYFTDV